MSKYNTDLDYAIPLRDIFPEELRKIAAEADAIIAENRGSTRDLAEAYYKKGMCLQKIEQCRDLREPDKAKQDEIKALIEKALELSPDMPEVLMQMGKIYKTLGGSDSGWGNLEKEIDDFPKRCAYGQMVPITIITGTSVMLN